MAKHLNLSSDDCKASEEVHFMRVEGTILEADLSEGMISYINIRDQIGISDQTYVKDWLITDFDHCLKGNPHVTN